MSKVKKVFAIILSMAMILGMSLTTFAAIGGASIEVRGLATTGKQKVDIYLIYSLGENDNSWEKSLWVPEGITETNLITETSLESLKEAALETDPDDTQETTTGTVTFNNLQAGAYLVLATDEANKTTYSTMVAVTYEYNAEGILVARKAPVVAKADTYIFEKEYAENQDVVEVGDLITYKITTVIPYVASASDDTEFKVSDTLTNATYYLTGNAVKDVAPVNKVTVGTTPVQGGIGESNHGNTSFELDLSSYVSADNTYAGQTVTIEYTAKVDGEVDEITNSASPSNDPDKEVTTTSYTGQMTILKTDDAKENAKPLAGATFKIYRYVDDSVKEYATLTSNGYVDGWTQNEAEADTVTTGDDGKATVKGLDLGTYYFKEVVAPDGYSINATDVFGTITKTDNEGVVTVIGDATMTDTKLSSLPSTGGIGTTIFTVGGCAIMIAAAGLFFASRRKESK